MKLKRTKIDDQLFSIRRSITSPTVFVDAEKIKIFLNESIKMLSDLRDVSCSMLVFLALCSADAKGQSRKKHSELFP